MKELKSRWKSRGFQLQSLFYFMMQILLKCKKNCVDHNSDFEETSVSFCFPKRQRLERRGFRGLSPPTSNSGNSEARCSSSAVTVLNHTPGAVMNFTCLVPFFSSSSSYDLLSSVTVMQGHENGETPSKEKTHMHFHNTHTHTHTELLAEC